MLRNDSLYERTGAISQTQAQNLLQNASNFVKITLQILKD